MALVLLQVANLEEQLQVRMWLEELFQADCQGLLLVGKEFWNQRPLCPFLKQASP